MRPDPVPYGAWPSPLTAADVARGVVRPSAPRLVGAEVWWGEARPEEGGRSVVVRRDAAGVVTDLLPAGWSARSRVHEYGGVAWLPVDGALVFANWADQRVYRIDPGAAEPVPLTPEPPEPAAWRYAEPVLAPDGTSVWWVREAHADAKIIRDLVAVPLDGSMQLRGLVGGSDFLASPRPSPDGTRVAWLAWDHPRMPWDGTELRVGTFRPDGTVDSVATVLGGPAESVLQPEWADADTLYAVTDRTGWWNLHRIRLSGGGPEPLCPRAEEFGHPLWQLGQATYGLLGDGRLLVRHGTDTDALGVLDPATGALTDLPLPYTSWQPWLSVAGGRVAGVAAGPATAPAVVLVDVAAGTATPLRASLVDPPDPAYLPQPRAVTVPGPGERDVHAWLYPPRSPDVQAPAGELPPYVVFVHGGPTTYSPAVLDLEKAYFTSRGIGVVDVNYGGSTGYGRAYRERLRRQWGVVDVEDCVAVAQALVRQGRADGARLAIRGGSAGGWTTLAALTGTDVFAAGTSHYGVAELVEFAGETHDFESRYVDGLVGVLPQDRDVYVERAPLSHVDKLSCPVLLTQGLEDRVVPPAQAERFVAALERNRIPYAYLAFEGEQHGFRRAETVARALEAELSFYGQVLGFTPPDVPVLPLSRTPVPS
ncbi:MAG: prolyl oligopeptidase family serine peptidase [Mycobacteriales bacterium]